VTVPERPGPLDSGPGRRGRARSRTLSHDDPGLLRSYSVASTTVGHVRAARTAGGAGADARAQFDAFFDAHHRDLARLAFLLSGDPDAADDLTAEAFTEAWKRWEQVTGSDVPLAYVRRIVVNLAASRVRRLVRERRGWRLLGAAWSERTEGPDVAASTDVRAALRRLPVRKRACVVLRHYYGLSEQETAATLGISVGTVKSQTSRGVAELAALLGGRQRNGTAAGAGSGSSAAPPAARRARPAGRQVRGGADGADTDADADLKPDAEARSEAASDAEAERDGGAR